MSSYRPYSGPPEITDAITARFAGKVAKGADDECWLWLASLDDKGYGMFKLDGRMWKAPRVAWLLAHGDPGRLGVCHRCDTPACVNPAHLFLGDQAANMQDCAAKGRLNTQRGQAGIHAIGVRGSLPRSQIANRNVNWPERLT